MTTKYKVLREHLNNLGYFQPFNDASASLVDKLLADFIQTTSSLKYYKKLAQTLTEEKESFKYGLEPYKCDNAKLLRECNKLHQELIETKDIHLQKEKELTKQNTKLEKQISELQSKILHLECAKKQPKRPQQSDKFHKTGFQATNNSTMCNCNSRQLKRAEQYVDNLCKEVINLKEDSQLKLELIDQYKNQLAQRESEIKRLRDLLEDGGRPQAALNQDCCYKNVDCRISQLTKEICHIRKEKNEIEVQLSEAILKQHQAMKNAVTLAERNRLLEKELRDIDHIALAVEADCNSVVVQNAEKVYKIQEELNTALCNNSKLQREINELKQSVAEKDAIKKLGDVSLQENKQLREQLNELKIIEHDLNIEIDRLSQINAQNSQKIKHKEISPPGKVHDSNKTPPRPKKKPLVKKRLQAGQEKGTMESRQSLKENVDDTVEYLRRELGNCQDENVKLMKAINNQSTSAVANEDATLAKLKLELKYYQDENIKLQELIDRYPQNAETTIELTRKLNERESALEAIQNELREMSRDKETLSQRLRELEEKVRWEGTKVDQNESDRSIIKKLQLQRDVAQSDVIRLEEERDALRMQLKLATKMQIEDNERYERMNVENENRIRKLELERHDAMLREGANQSTICNLKDQIEAYINQLKTSQTEICHLQGLYGQLKSLHEQTDEALADSQYRQGALEKDMVILRDQKDQVVANFNILNGDVCKKENDIAVLKNRLKLLDDERDNLSMKLDEKTEEVVLYKSQLAAAERRSATLENEIKELNRKLSISVDEIHSRESTVRNSQSESMSLRRELDNNRRCKEQTTNENRRLQSELNQISNENEILKKTLMKTQNEVEDLKAQLQGYVSEVNRFEEMIDDKERERNEMLDHFRTLSEEATVLENDSAATKMELENSKCKIAELEQALIDQTALTKSLERQVKELTAEIATLETRLRASEDDKARSEDELKSLRFLCTKLEKQKEALINEAAEKDNYRQNISGDMDHLKVERAQLRNDILQKANDIGFLEQTLKDEQNRNKELQMEIQQYKNELSNLQNKIDLQQLSSNSSCRSTPIAGNVVYKAHLKIPPPAATNNCNCPRSTLNAVARLKPACPCNFSKMSNAPPLPAPRLTASITKK